MNFRQIKGWYLSNFVISTTEEGYQLFCFGLRFIPQTAPCRVPLQLMRAILISYFCLLLVIFYQYLLDGRHDFEQHGFNLLGAIRERIRVRCFMSF